MFPASVRHSTRLPFSDTPKDLLTELGNLMGDAGRDAGADSIIPAGYTYFGQFVDHDITLDVSSTIDAPQDANTINNMRTPALDLDAVYDAARAGSLSVSVSRSRRATDRGDDAARAEPKHGTGRTTRRRERGCDTIELRRTARPERHEQRGRRAAQHVYRDHRRSAKRREPDRIAAPSRDAEVPQSGRGSPRHLPSGDIFAEAKKIVTQHYQWCVVHDFLPRVCGAASVNAAISSAHTPVEELLPHAGGIRDGCLSIRAQHDSKRLHPEFIAAANSEYARKYFCFRSSSSTSGILELGRGL
jgi:hypothetical protein